MKDKQPKTSSQNNNENEKYLKIVNQLEKKILFESEKQHENIQQIIYTLINLRHITLLESSLNHFIKYFEFILTKSAKSDKNKYMYFQQWIMTLCRVLEMHFLYE